MTSRRSEFGFIRSGFLFNTVDLNLPVEAKQIRALFPRFNLRLPT